MMKYLKAEAEIIKFDNSDIITESSDCGQPAYDEFEDTEAGTCFWISFLVWVVACWALRGWTYTRPNSSTDTYNAANSVSAETNGDWL